MFFKTDDKSAVKSVDFIKEFGTLYDLMIYLLGNAKRVLSSTEALINFFKAIYVLKTLISSIKNDTKDQSEEQKKDIFARKCFK